MSRRTGLLFFVALAPLVLDAATDTPSTRGHWLGPFFRLTPATQTTSVVCALLLVVLTLGVLFGRPDRGPSRPPDARLPGLWLLPVAPMVLSFFWTRPFVPANDALAWNAMVVAAPLGVAALVSARRDPVWIALVVAGVGVVLRWVHFAEFPIDEGADMLPLTRSAVATFVAGNSPYRYYDLPDPLPLTYYPITWLAYVPPYLAHLDLRCTNLVAELAIPVALVHAGGSGDRFGRRRSGPPSPPASPPRLALLAWAFQFLLPSTIYFDRITTAPVAWALLTWCLVAVVRAPARSWFALGLAAAATPLAAVMAPATIVAWWKGQSPRRAVIAAAKTALLTAAILAPFVIASPRGFLDGAVWWFNDLSRYPATTWRAYRPWARYVGFGGLFWSAGCERGLAPIQWGLVASTAALLARRARTESALGEAYAAHAAAAFVAFMSFNSVHWPYFFQPAICAALVALSVAGDEAHAGDGSQTRVPR